MNAVVPPLLAACLTLSSLVVVAAGCGDGDEPEPVVPLPCDVREAGCQRSVFRATALLRDQSNAELPEIRVITRAQFAEETRSAGGDTAPSRRDVIVENALRMVAFLPPDTGVGGAAAEASIAGVAAYYHKGTKAVTIIEDSVTDPLDGTYTLSHEFVHALQDQRENLRTLDDQARSADAALAIDALVEGEAVVLSNVLVATLRGAGEPGAVNTRFYDGLLNAFLGEIEESNAPLTHALLTLPYPVGGKPLAIAYGSALYAGIARFLDVHPLTYAEWVEGGEIGDLPLRLGCAVSEPPAGYGIVVNQRFGGAGLLALYTRLGLSGPEAFQAARAWTNDTFTVYGPDALANSGSVLAWRIGLRDAATAQQLASQVAASILNVQAVQMDREVLLVGATEPAVLAAWTAGTTCRIAKSAGEQVEPSRPMLPRPDWLP